MLEYRQTLDMGTENLLSKENWQHLHGDLPAHHPDERRQPGHQLHQRRGQVQPDHHRQHDLHDGPGLRLPLGVLQPPQHCQHQAGGGLATVQPRLPCPRHPGQCSPPGETFN